MQSVHHHATDKTFAGVYMAVISITKTSEEIAPRSSDPVQEATIGWLREVFELPPEAVLLPGNGGSLGCPIANTLTAFGLKNVFVMKTRLRYSEPGGQRRTVLFSSQVKRWAAKFDEGLIPELIDWGQRPVVYTTV